MYILNRVGLWYLIGLATLALSLSLSFSLTRSSLSLSLPFPSRSLTPSPSLLHIPGGVLSFTILRILRLSSHRGQRTAFSFISLVFPDLPSLRDPLCHAMSTSFLPSLHCQQGVHQIKMKKVFCSYPSRSIMVAPSVDIVRWIMMIAVSFLFSSIFLRAMKMPLFVVSLY